MIIRKNSAGTNRKQLGTPAARPQTRLTYEGKHQAYLWITGKGRARPTVKY